ncbi:RNA-directed DNA polymerase from mobile element jockey-like [Brachionus plicatilis]|uniref:RNA-directed DNA polymerase from mobile element jockey-like n=1 Tax=Brachionus plicatilis TaxID=10195 RepID=A0A3M7RX51_BRAPC|nr:RNA-directed DNA polymerase from mobile element jockey-like [Brachionus plicatilis]
MIKFGLSDKLIKILKLIYETLFRYNVMPKIFNIGLVKLLVKDQKKSNSDINNMRPLIISDCWSNILEKILLEEIHKCTQLKSNQYGFRSKSSCGHARKSKRTCVCSIDASKAFDKINRIMLWSKLISELTAWIVRTYGKEYEIKFNPNKTNYMIMFNKQIRRQENWTQEKKIQTLESKLVEFELTKSLIHELMAHDPDLSKDNKSLLYEISVITNRQTIYEMIKYGNEIVRQTVRRIVECRKDDEVKDIMEALEIEGDKRRIRLNQLLHIEY